MKFGCMIAAPLMAVLVGGSGASAATPLAPISMRAALAPGTLRIYSSLPLSGDFPQQPRDVLRGERMALGEAGGIAAGRPLQLVSLDDATSAAGEWDPLRTARNALRAAGDSLTIAYLGEFNSAASALSIPILNEAGILQVSPSNTYLGLTREGAGAGEPDKYYPTGIRSYGRVVPADHLQAAAIATLLASRGVKRALLLDDAEIYGTAMAAMVRRDATARGIQVQGPFHMRGRHLRARVGRLVRRAHASAMVFGGITDNNAAAIFTAAHRAAPAMTLVGDDGVCESAFTERLSARVARHTFITFPALPSSAYSAAARVFVTAFRARYGHAPEPYAIFGYEAMKVVLAAVDAGGADRAATTQAFFATRDRDSVLGRYSIDSNGDTTLSTYGLARVEHGQPTFDQVLDSAK
jgi:branched-chain amino acid transport system substrate-binding protein